jgi:hypothetical protein
VRFYQALLFPELKKMTLQKKQKRRPDFLPHKPAKEKSSNS